MTLKIDMSRVLIFFHAFRAMFRERVDLALEILALRQQVAVFKAKHPRPPLTGFDRVFWVLLRRLWSRWSQSLIIVTPETVIRWHREGFRRYWRFISCQGRRGRPRAEAEVRELIRRMARENPT